ATGSLVLIGFRDSFLRRIVVMLSLPIVVSTPVRRKEERRMPEVRVIQPITIQAADKLRVAAYARVSSDSADQRNSFSAQVKYYTQFIQAHEDWQFVDIYADQGITGTRADKRQESLRLMRDCRAGKSDRILVKSVSRFARNAQDCIK